MGTSTTSMVARTPGAGLTLPGSSRAASTKAAEGVMTEMLVLCPSRGRPEAAREAYAAFEATRHRAGTRMVFPIDSDDPRLGDYFAETYPVVRQEAPGNMVKALNAAAMWAIAELKPKYLGFIGDDHRFRTQGWDDHFVKILEERRGGFVYGNDLFWPKGEIPTQIFMSASIVEKLGWMGLPDCRHLYIDNAWRTLGEATQSLYYMPDVIIEHMHPAGGKAEWDEGHRRVNTPEMYGHDEAVFNSWLEGSLEEDLDRVRSALGRPAR
jgi:hypothetical protein